MQDVCSGTAFGVLVDRGLCGGYTGISPEISNLSDVASLIFSCFGGKASNCICLPPSFLCGENIRRELDLENTGGLARAETVSSAFYGVGGVVCWTCCCKPGNKANKASCWGLRFVPLPGTTGRSSLDAPAKTKRLELEHIHLHVTRCYLRIQLGQGLIQVKCATVSIQLVPDWSQHCWLDLVSMRGCWDGFEMSPM